MEYPIEQSLAKSVSSRTSMGYILVDSSLKILAANEHAAFWNGFSLHQMADHCLTDVLVEFVGLEPTLIEIIHNKRTTFELARVRHELGNNRFVYIDIQVEPFHQFGASLLITLLDVTQQTIQSQTLQQQRNELGILSAQLLAAREQLAFVLEHFVPSTVAQTIVEQQKLPVPGEIEQRTATILFADMRDFTKVAEHYLPHETLDILNAYLSVIIEAIQKFDGCIVQIVGDMIMATFNVPESHQDHALRGIQAALYTAKTVEQFAADVNSSVMPKLGFGIGICSGAVTAGYLGATQRYRYAVVGDATNVAFHLCSRAAAGQILAAEATVKDAILNADPALFHYRLLEATTLKRRSESVTIYEIERSSLN